MDGAYRHDALTDMGPYPTLIAGPISCRETNAAGENSRRCKTNLNYI